LESRWIYRGVEDSIRSVDFSSGKYPHSWITLSLRYSIRETHDFISINNTNAAARAAWGAGQSSDENTRKANEALRTALTTLPYLNAKKKEKPKTEEEHKSDWDMLADALRKAKEEEKGKKKG